MAPYRCGLLDANGESAGSVYLTSSSDADAVLLGNTIEREHFAIRGFEIRVGGRLVYLHRAISRSADTPTTPALVGVSGLSK